MVVDVRKLSNGAGPARPVYQHTRLFVRIFHFPLIHPWYSLFLFFIIYLQMMDVMLYFHIRSRGPLDSSLFLSTNQTSSESTSPMKHSIHMFDPLPIKKIMMESIVQYVRSPLAEQMETTLHFTDYFPFISANAISYFHCFLSLVSLKFLAHESLFRRRVGVVIFQFRTFLDCLDGVVFRAHLHNKRYKSYYGSFGYYVDAFSDILGGTCLMIGTLLYLYKQRPTRSHSNLPRSRICSSPSASDHSCEETDLMMLNIDDESVTRIPISSSTSESTHQQFESKETIFRTLLVFSFGYSLAAMFWDRYVHAYEDMLDSPAKTLQQQALQLSILHSPLTILIFYLWRYLSALGIQDYLQVAIFLDRAWEFVTKTRTISWFVLIMSAILTELHVNQIRSMFTALSSSTKFH